MAAGECVQQTCERLVANPSTSSDRENGDDSAPSWVVPAECDWRRVETGVQLSVEIAGLNGQRFTIAADWAARTVAVRPGGRPA